MLKEFHYVCSLCWVTFPFDSLLPKCACGGTLLVDYDLERAASSLTRETLAERPFNMWRYHELLPVRDLSRIVSLGEGGTPLIRLHALEQRLGRGPIWVKREEQNPSGSFKARGFSAAVTLLHERGVRKVTVPSNGNAASALAAYAARAGMEASVFLPKDCPEAIVLECMHYGARTYLVDGYIHDAARIVEEGKSREGWTNIGTLREPGRPEGKKTMGLEIAEQLGWEMPDVILYPTGGGSGIIGLWKAFKELKAMNWVRGELPRLVSVQEEGCEPIVQAFHRDGDEGVSDPSGAASSNPTGMRVPKPPDAQLMVRILKETGGTAIAVSAADIRESQQAMGRLGVSASPEGAASLAALALLADRGDIRQGERVVLFNTCHALKYPLFATADQVPTIRRYEDLLALPARYASQQAVR